MQALVREVFEEAVFDVVAWAKAVAVGHGRLSQGNRKDARSAERRKAVLVMLGRDQGSKGSRDQDCWRVRESAGQSAKFKGHSSKWGGRAECKIKVQSSKRPGRAGVPPPHYRQPSGGEQLGAVINGGNGIRRPGVSGFESRVSSSGARLHPLSTIHYPPSTTQLSDAHTPVARRDTMITFGARHANADIIGR